MRLARTLTVVLTTLAWATSPPRARAADADRPDASADDEVESLIRRGLELRRQGDDAAALPLFQRAYDRGRTPRAAAQLGFAHQALGQWLRAESLLAEAIAARDPWVARYRRIIADSLRDVRGHIASLAITGTPAGAEVILNGVPAGRLPLAAPLRVDEGRVTIEVRAVGHDGATRVVDARAGGTTLIDVRLAPRLATPVEPPPGAAPPEPDATSLGVPAAKAAADPAPIAAAPTPPDAPSRPSPLWGVAKWATALGALAGAGVGLYGYIDYRSNVSSFENRLCQAYDHDNDQATPAPFFVDDRTATETPPKASPVCQGYYDSYTSSRALAIKAFALGGGLALISTALFVFAPSGSADRAATGRLHLACSPAATTMGFACAGRF